MEAFDPLRLSRKLEVCAVDAHEWRLRLKAEPEHFDDPLAEHRDQLTLSRYLEISEALHESDPLREPLLRWVHYLLEQRVNHWWYTASAQLRYVDKTIVEEPTRSEQRVCDVIRSLLTDPRRALFARALNAVGPQLAAANSSLWQRQAEVAKRLNLETPDAHASPLAAIEAFAERVLTESDDMASQFTRSEPGAWLDQVMRPLPQVEFPSRINERNVSEWFRESRLLEAVDLKPWPLPAALGPTSFMRVLYELGFEFRGALSDRRQPFVIRQDPYAMEQHATGWCFSSLFTNPEFLARNLNVGRTDVRDVKRALGTVLLFDLRLRAFGVLLGHAAQRGNSEFVEVQQAYGSRVFGAPFGASTAGILPRLRHDAEARLVGACLGQQQTLDLRAQHNEDWYRNPRAIDQLRSVAVRSPEFRADLSRVDAGFESLLLQLRECLS